MSSMDDAWAPPIPAPHVVIERFDRCAAPMVLGRGTGIQRN